MACGPGTSIRSGEAWTRGSTSNTNFIPFFEVDIAQVKSFKLSVFLEAIGGSFQATRAYRTSDDRITWSAVTTIGTGFSSAGWNYGDSYTAPAIDDQYAQVGLQCVNTSGADPAFARVAIKLDTRPQTA